jgi:hypothetical protein
VRRGEDSRSYQMRGVTGRGVELSVRVHRLRCDEESRKKQGVGQL